ncbi:hypothetical protein QGN29_06660 [Temperatibacter marinus]|uniref:PAS domain-containing protein n=1 Tax=Temperatibacter marinus TaxID=1456591 RepID=A0AA52EKA6_9PROT|nr:hypothetical protein [Temperatibacter marinus]WND04054.1 hypothetical protein QGN29_06660 [Temperatibacter marinus]
MNLDIQLNPDLADIQSEDLKDFYERWLALKDQCGGYPQRANLDPNLFISHLPWVALNAYDPELDQFRVRIFGTAYVEAVGRDPTGQIVQSPGLIKKFKEVVRTGSPYLSLHNQLVWADREFRYYNVLGVPFFTEDKCVSHIFFRVEFSAT